MNGKTSGLCLKRSRERDKTTPSDHPHLSRRPGTVVCSLYDTDDSKHYCWHSTRCRTLNPADLRTSIYQRLMLYHKRTISSPSVKSSILLYTGHHLIIELVTKSPSRITTALFHRILVEALLFSFASHSVAHWCLTPSFRPALLYQFL